MGFFNDPEDWVYVVDPDSFGVLNAMITHSFFEGFSKRIVVELINNKLYSVIGHNIPDIWSCDSIEYGVAFTNTTKFSLPTAHHTTQSLFEMFKKESEL